MIWLPLFAVSVRPALFPEQPPEVLSFLQTGNKEFFAIFCGGYTDYFLEGTGKVRRRFITYLVSDFVDFQLWFSQEFLCPFDSLAGDISSQLLSGELLIDMEEVHGV